MLQYQKIRGFLQKVSTKHMTEQLPKKKIILTFEGETWPSFAKFSILILISLSVIKREDFQTYVVSCFFLSCRHCWLKQLWDIIYQY